MTHDNQNSARGLTRYEPIISHNTGVGPMPGMGKTRRKADAYYLASEVDALLASRADAPPRGGAVAWVSADWDNSVTVKYLKTQDEETQKRWLEFYTIPLYASPPPALPVCASCKGAGFWIDDSDESGTGMRVECKHPIQPPALSEGLPEAVKTALAWIEKEEYSEEYPHINTHYQMVTEMRKKDYFQMAGKILAAEVRRLSPAAPLEGEG